MVNITNINNPLIKTYIKDFIKNNEIDEKIAQDQHLVFEMYLNSLVLDIYTNDRNASFTDMETGKAIGIDGLAIFIADKFVKNIEDVDLISESVRKFEVDFYFIQAKTTDKFSRNEMNDFFNAVIKFFDFEKNKCLIPELEEFWEVAKYIYQKAGKFKSQPKLNLIYGALAPSEPKFNDDIHLKIW